MTSKQAQGTARQSWEERAPSICVWGGGGVDAALTVALGRVCHTCRLDSHPQRHRVKGAARSHVWQVHT